jgi:hypothetical protein
VSSCCPATGACCAAGSGAACCTSARPHCCPAGSEVNCCSDTFSQCVSQNANGVTCCQAGNLPCLTAGNTGCCPRDRLCAGGDSTGQLCCPQTHPFGCHAGTAKWCCPTAECGTANDRCGLGGFGANTARGAGWAEAVVVPVDRGADADPVGTAPSVAVPPEQISAPPLPSTSATPGTESPADAGRQSRGKKRTRPNRKRDGATRKRRR